MTTLAAASPRSSDLRVIGLVSVAHFVSHIYLLVLPPLFPFVRAEFNVSYTELGSVVAVFNLMSALLQTPAGFLVDRTSARAVLVGGLLLGAASLIGAAVLPGFLLFGLMFALLGLANTVYHPANYSLLSNRVSARRMGQAFSVHIFAGFIGTAVTPAAMILGTSFFGWRGAFVAAALLGVAVAAALIVFGEPLAGRESARAAPGAAASGNWRVLLTTPVLLNLFFFTLLAAVGVGVQSYGIVALEALWQTPLALGTTAITVFLMCSAFAVLAGGFLAARTERHDLITIVGLGVSGAALLPVGLFDLNAALLLAFMAVSGIFNGALQPSRDMIVRAATPPGAFGRVFGFVTTGFNIGWVIAPPVFGWLMDIGSPRAVLVATALISIAAIPLIPWTMAHRADERADGRAW